MLELLGMNVSSIAADQIFEGMQRIILRQPIIDFVSRTPSQFRDRLKFSGFAIRMNDAEVAKLGLERNATVDIKAEYVLGTTMGGNNNAPLIELAGTAVMIAAEQETAGDLPW